MINNNGKWIVSAHTRGVLNMATRISTGNSLLSWIRAKGARGKCWIRNCDCFPANSRELIVYARRVVDIVSYLNERAAGRRNLLLNGKQIRASRNTTKPCKPQVHCSAISYSLDIFQIPVATMFFFECFVLITWFPWLIVKVLSIIFRCIVTKHARFAIFNSGLLRRHDITFFIR